jgi:sirohydrochlorin ferrochelatase
MSLTGYVVFAHGSSIESANEAVRTVAADMARLGGSRLGDKLVTAAFLEGGSPSLPRAMDDMATRGVSRVIVIPYFLTLGLHLQRDLPRLVEAARGAHAGLEIVVCDPLDGHPGMAEMLLDRALEGARQETR